MARPAAVVALALTVLGVALALVNGHIEIAVASVGACAFPLVAFVVFRSDPANHIGWVFVAAGALLGTERSSEQLALIGTRAGWSETAVHAAVWPQTWAWFPGLFLLITVGLLRFPDGRLPGRAWRWSERLAYLAMAVWSIGIGTATLGVPAPDLMRDDPPDPSGPWGPIFRVGVSMFAVAGVAAVLALVSLVLRYRRSPDVEREQIRWVLYAGTIAIVLEATVDFAGQVANPPDWVQSLGEGVGFSLIAVAVGVAITRYKLYEIDRIVSRTLAYATVLVVLAAVYVAALLGLAAFVPTDLGQLGVAVATLLVSALAVPLTRQVRRLVDRRFNRSRFDAERVVAAFAADLRARPDAGNVPVELLDVLRRTVQPSHASVWLVP